MKFQIKVVAMSVVMEVDDKGRGWSLRVISKLGY